MGFPPPVAGPIHPSTWVRPPGNREFQVTSTFGPRVLTIGGKRVGSIHKGLDLGNARTGAPVFAQGSGTVVEWRPELDGVVTIRTTDDQWELVLAHMQNVSVKLWQKVKVGQVVGQVGMVGAPGQPHLHIENKQRTAGGYIARDPLPLLEQESDVLTTVDRVLYLGANGKPQDRVVNFAAGTYTGYHLDGTKKTVAVGNTSAPARSLATITHVPDADPHGPNWLEIVKGTWAGYYIRIGPGISVAADPVTPAAQAASSTAAAAVTEAAKYQ